MTGAAPLLLAALLVLGLLLPAATRADSSPQSTGRNAVILDNEFIEVRANERGQYTIGTAEGDPASGEDDNRRLIYGHGRSAFTSFSTIRTEQQGMARDLPLLGNLVRRPQVRDGAMTMEWDLDGVSITQTLTLAENPYTSRADTVRIALSATNTSDEPLRAGARIMIDTMIGDNDDAPFFVPGSGNFDVEREYAAEEMPLYWKAFEAPDYDPASLKSQGIITGLDATPPDRFVFASWRRIKDTAWDYPLIPGVRVGDSAVAAYWKPDELQPGATVTWVTYYGLAGVGGGNAWIDAPLDVTSTEPEFPATLWVANLSDEDFTGGEARIELPPGLRLAPGETGTKPMADVPVNGGAQSVTWRLVAGGDADTDYPYSATATFRTGSEPLSASAQVSYRFVAPAATLPPTPTRTPTVTPVPLAVAPPPAEREPFPWPWLLLVPLLGLPLLFLLLRRRPERPATRIAPPRAARNAPQPDFTERPTPGGPAGADVTHGRKQRGDQDPDGNPM